MLRVRGGGWLGWGPMACERHYRQHAPPDTQETRDISHLKVGSKALCLAPFRVPFLDPPLASPSECLAEPWPVLQQAALLSLWWQGQARIQGGGRRGRRPSPRKVGKAPDTRQFVRHRPPSTSFWIRAWARIWSVTYNRPMGAMYYSMVLYRVVYDRDTQKICICKCTAIYEIVYDHIQRHCITKRSALCI